MLNFLIKTAQAYDFKSESGLNTSAGKLGFTGNQLTATPDSLIASSITYILGFLGIIFLSLTIYAGGLWMTSRGDAKIVEKARDILINSIVGLTIVALAYAITYLVINTIQ